MAIAPPSGVSSANVVVWQQLQQQQAQRTASQAEQKAAALQLRAREAQADADRAQEKASTLQVQSDQAQDRAGKARQGLVALRSISEVQGRFQALREGIASSTFSVAAPVNAEGQVTGTLVDVTA